MRFPRRQKKKLKIIRKTDSEYETGSPGAPAPEPRAGPIRESDEITVPCRRSTRSTRKGSYWETFWRQRLSIPPVRSAHDKTHPANVRRPEKTRSGTPQRRQVREELRRDRKAGNTSLFVS